MNGKQKCELLRNVRKEIALANGIEMEFPECKHKGDCLGTCPACENEVRQLEDALNRKAVFGDGIVVKGVAETIVDVVDAAAMQDQRLSGKSLVPHTMGNLIPIDPFSECVQKIRNIILSSPKDKMDLIIEKILLDLDGKYLSHYAKSSSSSECSVEEFHMMKKLKATLKNDGYEYLPDFDGLDFDSLVERYGARDAASIVANMKTFHFYFENLKS